MAVSGRLAGLQVVVISLPNAQKGLRDQVLKTLGDAGAVVTGQIEITGTYVDPQQTSTLDDLARALAPPTVDLSKLDTVPARAAAVLTSAIVSPQPDVQGAGSTATSAALPAEGVTPAGRLAAPGCDLDAVAEHIGFGVEEPDRFAVRDEVAVAVRAPDPHDVTESRHRCDAVAVGNTDVGRRPEPGRREYGGPRRTRERRLHQDRSGTTRTRRPGTRARAGAPCKANGRQCNNRKGAARIVCPTRVRRCA